MLCRPFYWYLRMTGGALAKVEWVSARRLASFTLLQISAGVCVILHFYTATCGPKGHGGGGFYMTITCPRPK